MVKVAIIADDFSSVTDNGVQFVGKGLRIDALLEYPDTEPDCDILAVDTDSRPDSAETAYDKVYALASKMRGLHCERVYKSLDSTLRGNLGAEIDAAMDAFGYQTALVAPAFPFYGRKTVKGIHYLDGVLISESMMANDPACPVRESNVERLLHEQTKRRIARVSLDALRGDMTELLALIRALAADGNELILFDAEEESDLRKIADASYFLPEMMVAGSTGLAQYLADGWRLGAAEEAAAPLVRKAPLIFAATSASPVTAAQIRVLLEHPSIYAKQFDPWALATEGFAAELDGICTALRQGWDIALYLDVSPEGRARVSEKSAAHHMGAVELSRRIAGSMAELVHTLLQREAVSGVVMTGGDTAKAICDRIGCTGMEIAGQSEAGIPYGKLLGISKDLSASIKAGAFGAPEAYLLIREKLTGAENREDRK